MSQERIEGFYDENPFPYLEPDEIGSPTDLYSRINDFGKVLERNISSDAEILVAGCGAGLLANFLALNGREVHGIDISRESLDIAEEVKESLDLENVDFEQKDLLELDTSRDYDLVVSLGVVHHLPEPWRGLEVLSRCLKEDGYLVVGVYNRYGRIPTKIRKIVFKLTGGRFRWIDPYLRNSGQESREKREVYFNDQYRHPEEHSFSLGELVSWFDEHGIEFLGYSSRLKHSRGPDEPGPLDRQQKPGFLERALIQAGWIMNGAGGNGYIVVTGKNQG